MSGCYCTVNQYGPNCYTAHMITAAKAKACNAKPPKCDIKVWSTAVQDATVPAKQWVDQGNKTTKTKQGVANDSTLGLRRDVDLLMAGEGRLRLGGAMHKEVFGLSTQLDTVVTGLGPGVSFDVREAVAWLRPVSWLELRAGRQTLSWGTSPLAPNSLFRKDLTALFLGRDLAYVRAPVNALHLRLGGSRLALDAIWMPIYEPDQGLNGYPFLFHDPSSGLSSILKDIASRPDA